MRGAWPVRRAAAVAAVAGLLCALAGAATTAASPGASERRIVRYVVSVTGSFHIHGEDPGQCSDGGSILSTEDYDLQLTTVRPQSAWVVPNYHTPPPPGFRRASPGIYGFGHNGWMSFRVAMRKHEHSEICDGPSSDARCSRAHMAEGRFESVRHPATMYFAVLNAGQCISQFGGGDFVSDLYGNAALASVPLGKIVHRLPSTFGFHRRQQRRFDTWRVTADIDWQAHIEPADELVAVALASPVDRGGIVRLDGSKSFRGIKSYRWNFARAAGCPSDVGFTPETVKGARVSFPALCPFKATLTVSDGKSTDSDTITAPVKARPWKTPFSRAPDGVLDTKLVDGNVLLGRNVCAYDGLTGAQTSGHILHRSGPGGDHDPQGGFTVAKVTAGPFKGDFYVAIYRTKIRRAALISKDLYSGSDLYTANDDAGHLDDLLALRDSVRDHEELHSTLIQRALAKSDRAKAIEAMVDGNETALTDRVNVALVELETVLTDATSDANVKAQMPAKWNRPATVLIRDGGGGFVTRTFPSLAQLGDNGP